MSFCSFLFIDKDSLDVALDIDHIKMKLQIQAWKKAYNKPPIESHWDSQAEELEMLITSEQKQVYGRSVNAK